MSFYKQRMFIIVDVYNEVHLSIYKYIEREGYTDTEIERERAKEWESVREKPK